MKNTMKKSLSVAMGATFAAAMAASPIANADESPFGMQALQSGYLQVAEADSDDGKMNMEGKCGEGKAKMKKEGKCGEGKCGEGKMKADGKMNKEGKCGGSKPEEKAGDAE